MKTKKVSFENPSALSRFRKKLQSANAKRVRVLHLGDSNVASDFITSMARHLLQQKHGDGGRGFMHIDQPWGYGGRRLKRGDRKWMKDRIVDKDRAGRPYGFSGITIESKKKKATAVYQVLRKDESVRIYYQAQPKGGALDLFLGKKKIGELDTKGEKKSLMKEFALPERSKKKSKLKLVARGPKVRLYGISFEKKSPGIIYESIGPVGADAKVYLQLDQDSFKEHLQLHKPDLIALMVGGNDALKIRKKWTTLEKVTEDHVNLLDNLKKYVPEADCLMWAPMDAGKKKGKKVVTLAYLEEIRDMQRRLAAEKGCAFFDFFEAMGGKNSINRWVSARVMNKDLVHPKKVAADLLGRLFYDSWEDWLVQSP